MEQNYHHSGVLKKQRLSRTGILYTLLFFLFLTGAGYAGISDETAGTKELTASRAERIIWDIPEVGKQAAQIRSAGARPFTMVEAASDGAGTNQYIIIYFGEDHATHTVRRLTFKVERTSGRVFVYDPVNERTIPLHVWQEENRPVITMERTRCYGRCPVYTITILRNGTVVYQGQEFVLEKGIRTSVLAAGELKRLIDQFRHAQFFLLQDSYNSYSITDQPTVIISFTDQGKTKTISHYLGDTGAPEILLVLETEVDRTVNSRHWIDGVRQ